MIDIDKRFKRCSKTRRIAIENWPTWKLPKKNHDEAEKRIEAMKCALVQTDLSCKVICLDVGIREDSGARLFKRKTGKTMKQFRKESKQIPL